MYRKLTETQKDTTRKERHILSDKKRRKKGDIYLYAKVSRKWDWPSDPRDKSVATYKQRLVQIPSLNKILRLN